ncbi:hypothetical protein PMIN04_013245 [Paraphaeosphaeria minitans]|uniref:Uncharacterized protein n=1 Tax=Paraphaeosphaeria minitans TaxID=565426 RepID=A0A9P6KIZ9_9PLEO|nr:hypothetical protein PMIN01_13238 [Paraphaeosphaeria minitans]
MRIRRGCERERKRKTTPIANEVDNSNRPSFHEKLSLPQQYITSPSFQPERGIRRASAEHSSLSPGSPWVRRNELSEEPKVALSRSLARRLTVSLCRLPGRFCLLSGAR